jgi:hypothetical protein
MNILNEIIIILLFLISLFMKTHSEVFKILMIITIVIFTITLNIFIYTRHRYFLNISIIYFIIFIYFLILYVVLSNIENDKTITQEKRTCNTEKVGIYSSIVSIIIISLSLYFTALLVKNHISSRNRSNAVLSI